MPIRDFHTWMQQTDKKFDIEENQRRTGLSPAYPPGYQGGAYPPQVGRTISATAAYYDDIRGKGKKKK